MFVLKLLLFSFVLPCFLILLAIIFIQHRRLAGVLLTIALLWFYIPATQFFASHIATAWQYPEPINLARVTEFAPAAIVVLSAAYNFNDVEYPQNRTISEHTLYRTRYAAEIAKQYQLPLLTTGGVIRYKQDETLANVMATVLEQDFSVQATWLEEQSRTTLENAKFSAEILFAEDIRNIILITGALHMPRSILAFQRFGFTVVPAATNFEKPYKSLINFIPRAEYYHLSMRVFYEMLGYFVYKYFSLP